MDNMTTGSLASVHERPWLNTSLSPDERAALLLTQMTLEEKIGMVHGKSNDAYSMAPIARLGIPALTMADGPAGINEGQATALPAPIGLAATWDLAAAQQLGERTLQEIYTLPFALAVQEGHVGAAMGAYNKVNGVYSCENPHLLTEILKQQLGFTGWVMSDFEATHSTVEAANAGLDQ